MGGAAASETLIGWYICTIGGCNTPQKQPRENSDTYLYHHALTCCHVCKAYTQCGRESYSQYMYMCMYVCQGVYIEAVD